MQSRYDKGETEADRTAYLNCPMDRTQYEAFIDALLAADKTDFEEKVNKALSPLKLDITKILTIYTQDSAEKRVDRPGGTNTLALAEPVRDLAADAAPVQDRARHLLLSFPF